MKDRPRVDRTGRGIRPLGAARGRRARLRFSLSAAIALAVLASGCRSVRPVTCYGHDLVENPGHLVSTRFFAGIGAIAGTIVAFPLAVLLVPSVITDAAVDNADSPRPGEVRPAGSPADRSVGDHTIPLVLAPFEYGQGLGAAFLGAPAEWVARPFTGRPPPPPGEVEEPPGPELTRTAEP